MIYPCALRGSDISSADPLRVFVKGDSQVLSCEVIQQTQKSDNFALFLADDKKSVKIRFDYLDKGHGAVIKIRYTGDDGAIVKGSIQSVSEIKKLESTITSTMKSQTLRRRKRILMIGESVFWSLFIVFYFIARIANLPIFEAEPSACNMLIFDIMMAVLLVFIIVSYILLLGTPKVPHGLVHIFYGDEF